MSRPRFDCTPFELAGDDTACLLIHGFTATPYDMRFFGEKLHGCGFSVRAVCLPGHASRVEEMERHSWQDWYDAVVDDFDQLPRHSRRRVIVGQSMGALLALKLAHDRPDEVDGVVAVSTALVASNRLLNWAAPILPLLHTWLPSAWRILGKGDSDIADPKARQESQAYRGVPLRSVHELLELQKAVRPLLPAIRQPVLAIHSRQDHTCPVENVAMLEGDLGGPVRSLWLDNSFHVVSVDCDKEIAVDAICRFAADPLAFVA